jgi:hypothetical protein
MRTTVDLDDQLLLELKKIAAQRRRSLKSLIEDAIRLSLDRDSGGVDSAPRQSTVTFRGRGVRSGVNLDSTSELLDAMERGS